MRNVFSKGIIGSLMATTMLVSVAANAQSLPPQDTSDKGPMTITIDKSTITGSLVKNSAGNLVYDDAGNARFAYTGQIFSIQTDANGNAIGMSDAPIGQIEGEAAFPKAFVTMSAGVNALMDSMMNGTWDGTMPQFPSIVPWTCNHCDMTVGGRHYISIVDALDENSPYYNAGMVEQLNAALLDGAAGAMDNMRMKGRAFTGLGPTTFHPWDKTMGVRMAGCSALLDITDMENQTGMPKIGTLCMNATATFNVSGAIPRFSGTGQLIGYTPDSAISANGSSNCVTVMQPM